MPGVADFLRERETLIASAKPGPEAARQLSDMSDRAVSALAEAALSALPGSWTVLALGGWGAGRLLPLSDLDLLVIADAPPATLRSVLRDVLYPLWDAGLSVGHQVRTRRDHERMCRTDLETLTATLTGRVLCGDSAQGDKLLAAVAADAAKRGRKSHAPALMARDRPGSPYLLEPDLKDGAGGQRDLDELTWLGCVLSGRPCADPEALAEAGVLGPDELALARDAGAQITAARWVVHRGSARASALMTLELGSEPDIDAERLQRSLADAHHLLLRVRGRLAGRPTRFDPRVGAVSGPSPAVAAARAATTTAPVDADSLFSLLDAGVGSMDALEEAAWAGLLDDLAPAFGELMTVRRPALSHRYTVGAHCLHAALSLGTLATTNPETAAASARLTDRRPLQVAALLHDVGKVQRAPGHADRGAAAVRTLGGRFGLRSDRLDQAAFLVREHLLLAETASGEDIHNEDVILRAASRIPDPDSLDALFLLTVADSLATGPGAWTSWHAALIGEFAHRLGAALSDEVAGTGLVEHAESVRAQAIALAGGGAGAAPLVEFARRASLRYLATVPAEDVVRHASLAADVAASGLPDGFRTSVSPGPTDESWRVSIAACDRAGLFADICGALSLTGLDIMGADAYDAQNGVAIDVFVVRSDTRASVDPATWAMFERHLHAAFADPSGLATRLAERQQHYPANSRYRTRIAVRESGDYANVVEVRAGDRVGLLYDLAGAFVETGLLIRWARALTKDGVAHDVFHVTDEFGEPVDDPGVLGHLSMRIRERS